MDFSGNTAPIIRHGNGTIWIQHNGDRITMPCQCLVNRIIDNLIDHVMQTCAIIRITDIHARAFSDSFQAFQNLDGGRAVIFLLIIPF